MIMARKIIIKVTVSCDPQFIDRVANEDPFWYYNNHVKSEDEAELKVWPDAERIKIEVEKTDSQTSCSWPTISSHTTHIITYEVNNTSMIKDSANAYCIAIMMFFKPVNIIYYDAV